MQQGHNPKQPGAHEASNPDVADNVIGTSRAELLFRANLKVLQVANSVSEYLLTLLRR